MRTPVMAGNWKMNTTSTEAVRLVAEMRQDLDLVQGVEKIVCPPFISLESVAQVIKGTTIKLGAQNMHYESGGAFTGEVSPSMLSELCEYVIVGHSERRMYFQEDDELINKKVAAALGAGLKPILAVGERLEEREGGKTELVVTSQVQGGLAGIPRSESLVLAYEPVWAIGTGLAASSVDANETIGLIRSLVAKQYGDEFAQIVRILYGGSVSPSNVAEFMAQPEIDGGLVGGASLKAADFIELVRQASDSDAHA